MERLKVAVQTAETLATEEKVIGVEDALKNVAETAAKTEGMPELAPGTQHVGKIMSAKVRPCSCCDLVYVSNQCKGSCMRSMPGYVAGSAACGKSVALVSMLLLSCIC